jgi:uncharacterized protein YjiS (DUF1127 family)
MDFPDRETYLLIKVSNADILTKCEDTMSNRLESAPVERVLTEPKILWPEDEQRLIAAAHRLRAEYTGVLFRNLGKYVRRKFAEFGQTLADARAARVLSEMSDRELADIGLTRGDIGAIAAGKAQQIAAERTLHVERLAHGRRPVWYGS